MTLSNCVSKHALFELEFHLGLKKQMSWWIQRALLYFTLLLRVKLGALLPLIVPATFSHCSLVQKSTLRRFLSSFCAVHLKKKKTCVKS